jgi:DNA-binding transcriptional regulator YdaS (Cro superfamily)
MAPAADAAFSQGTGFPKGKVACRLPARIAIRTKYSHKLAVKEASANTWLVQRRKFAHRTPAPIAKVIRGIRKITNEFTFL